jgi:hypothetical protein
MGDHLLTPKERACQEREEVDLLQQFAEHLRAAQQAKKDAAYARTRVQAAVAVLEKERAIVAVLEAKAAAVLEAKAAAAQKQVTRSSPMARHLLHQQRIRSRCHRQPPCASGRHPEHPVPLTIVLEVTSTNFSPRRDQMLLTLKRFSLADHVLCSTVFLEDLAWDRMDNIVLSWVTGTISVELKDIIRERGGTDRHAWIALENQFLENQETQALHLDAQFRNFVQGDLTVGEYCQKMKGFADALADLNTPVTDQMLVLTLLRGLNPRYENLRMIITRSNPFPSFQKVRDDLILEELMGRPDSAATTLYNNKTPVTTTPPATASSSSRSTPTSATLEPAPTAVLLPAVLGGATEIAATEAIEVVPPGRPSSTHGQAPSKCGPTTPLVDSSSAPGSPPCALSLRPGLYGPLVVFLGLLPNRHLFHLFSIRRHSLLLLRSQTRIRFPPTSLGDIVLRGQVTLSIYKEKDCIN